MIPLPTSCVDYSCVPVMSYANSSRPSLNPGSTPKPLSVTSLPYIYSTSMYLPKPLKVKKSIHIIIHPYSSHPSP